MTCVWSSQCMWTTFTVTVDTALWGENSWTNNKLKPWPFCKSNSAWLLFLRTDLDTSKASQPIQLPALHAHIDHDQAGAKLELESSLWSCLQHPRVEPGIKKDSRAHNNQATPFRKSRENINHSPDDATQMLLPDQRRLVARKRPNHRTHKESDTITLLKFSTWVRQWQLKNPNPCSFIGSHFHNRWRRVLHASMGEYYGHWERLNLDRSISNVVHWRSQECFMHRWVRWPLGEA